MGDPRRDGRVVDFAVRLRQPVDHAQLPRSRPACPTATRCSRRCRRCAAAARSTPTCGCATPASRGSRRSPTTRRSATATCWARSCSARPSSATALIVFLTDVTDAAAHGGRAARLRRHGRPRPARAGHGDRAPRHAARAPRRRAALAGGPAAAARRAPSARASSSTACSAYARAGELQRERVALDRVMSDVAADLRARLDDGRRDARGRRAARGRRRRAPAAPRAAEPGRQRGEVPRRAARRASRSPPCAAARSGW